VVIRPSLNFASNFWAWHKSKYGWYIPKKQLKIYNWIKLARNLGYYLDLNLIETRITEFINSDEHKKAKPFTHAVNVLKQLKQQGFNIYIITARAYKEHSAPTLDWVNKNLKNLITDVIFTRQTTKQIHVPSQLTKQQNQQSLSKAQICKDLNVNVFTEDAIHNLINFNNNNIKLIAYLQP